MQIYLGRGGQREGPFTLEQVRERLAQGQAQTSDLAWYEGAPGWVQVAQLPGLNPPAQSSVPPPIQPVSPGFPASRGPVQPTEPLSIASLILGLVGLFMVPFLASIPGVICGHLALGRIKRAAGVLGGHGMAVAGLVTGYLGIALWGIMLLLLGLFFVGMVSMAGPIISTFKDGFSAVPSVADATTIHTACAVYANEHDGNFPPTLEALVPKYLPERSMLESKVGDDPTKTGYLYFGGKNSDPGNQILFQSRGSAFGNEHVVARINGNVMLEDPDAVHVLPEPELEEKPSKEP